MSNGKTRAQSGEETLRGVGLGAMFYGIGNTGVSNPAHADLSWGVPMAG
jgi:hypothetical protein